MLSRRRVDGVIVAASRIGADYATQLEQIRIPVIMINNQAEGEFENLYAIAIDDFQGGCLAVEHLIALGHRRIGYLGVKNRPSSNERRMEGYLHTLEQHAIPFQPDWIQMNEGIIPEGLSGDLRAGHDLALNLLKSDLTAVFCYCDSVAAGMLIACRELNIDVPNQISLVGFDDSDLCPLLCPPLTTIRQPKREMGQMAMKMLVSSMAGGLVNDLRLEPSLVVRQSTAAPPIPSQSKQNRFVRSHP